MAKIRISCHGEIDILQHGIVLVVFSFYDVTASSNKRLVTSMLVLRVGLSHEPGTLTKINALAALRKIPPIPVVGSPRARTNPSPEAELERIYPRGGGIFLNL